MSDTKWADVAHYYTKSHIEVVSLRGSNPKTGQLMGMYQSDAVTVMFGKNQNVDKRKFSVVQLEWCKPILTHLRDMTEAQVLECIKCGWPVVAGKPIKEFACIPDHSEFGSAFTYKIVFDGSPHYMAGTMSFRSLDSNQFVWLISRGFDVFGLIESGQAIRKEMGNGNS